ncbi:MAG: HAD family hydrolase [Acidimicrobiales bacterium]
MTASSSRSPVRVAMWSGPRNLSTALLRSWENRPDTQVLDEPLYAHYLATTGLDHPGRADIIAAGPTSADEAIARCLAPLSNGNTISYQKHMSHHLLPDVDRGWLDEVYNLLLIRDPVLVLASYASVRSDVTLADIGLLQQVELAERAELIVDSSDFLEDPERYQRAVCANVGIDFTPAMLRWPAGTRSSDGCWAPHWYAAVEASTGFGPPSRSGRPEVESLPAHLQPLATEARSIYNQLAADRLLFT